MKREPVSAEHRPDREPVGKVADFRISSLQGGYRADHPEAVALMARLRRGAGKLPHDTPELWGETYLASDFAELPWNPTEEEEERAETAIHVAFTLYALHQQSVRDGRMHRRPVRNHGYRRDHDLGSAMRRLMGEEIDEPLRKRFVHAGTATTIGPLAFRLRGLVRLLRASGVALDYGLLADQLYTAQREGGMRRVRRDWGRGFVSYRPDDESANDATTTESQ
ncbi:type I-E CRISPR-associated protein Cse2/CasB [Halostreptopolyspora alba]|uniref:Type I-E CRISPR-associated protein Cse2/CasB n=1 Tax=Halostreptopolyspora alba TaxID=2487137 RepID=A0A3N0EHH6_9ACTN|nr:type I-E CRISPR-associated protein Cse2/CasB [Nocardiopsaceae bacterium YIM 96095]